MTTTLVSFRSVLLSLGGALTLASTMFTNVGVAQSTSTATGAVYTSTNATTGNQVAIYARAVDGSLTFQQMVATGGVGTGAGLGNQGAVVLSSDEQWLYVVNAGSNTLSVFRVLENGLQLVTEQRTGGRTPISVTQFGDRVYVVHSGTSSISGFRQNFDGTLTFLPNSRRSLSDVNAGPAQIGFSRDGRDLYVTEKNTNRLSHFSLDGAGLPGTVATTPSAGLTPFGFAFGYRNQLIVSEAGGGVPTATSVSSYQRLGDGSLAAISASVPTGESAACWIVTTPDQRIAYAANAGTASVSSFRIGFDGALTLIDPRAAVTAGAAIDMSVTPDGRFFYVRLNGVNQIDDYRIDTNGALVAIPGTNGGLPAGSTGLAVR